MDQMWRRKERKKSRMIPGFCLKYPDDWRVLLTEKFLIKYSLCGYVIFAGNDPLQLIIVTRIKITNSFKKHWSSYNITHK